MPRTWGYLAVAAAIVIGCLALLLPVPETVDIAPMPQPTRKQPAKPVTPKPAVRPKAKRPSHGQAQKPPRFPMQDTTKTRLLVKPKSDS